MQIGWCVKMLSCQLSIMPRAKPCRLMNILKQEVLEIRKVAIIKKHKLHPFTKKQSHLKHFCTIFCTFECTSFLKIKSHESCNHIFFEK
jgi:hypothetical protein